MYCEKQKRIKVAANSKPKASPQRVKIIDKEIMTVTATVTGDNGSTEANASSDVDVVTSSTTVRKSKVVKVKPITKAAARKLELEKQKNIQNDEAERYMVEMKERRREQDLISSSHRRSPNRTEIHNLNPSSSTTFSTSSLLQQSPILSEHPASPLIQAEPMHVHVDEDQEDDMSIDDDSDGDVFDDNYKKRKKMKNKVKKSRS